MSLKIVFAGPAARATRDEYVSAVEQLNGQFVTDDDSGTVSKLVVEVDRTHATHLYPLVGITIDIGGTRRVKLIVYDNERDVNSNRSECKLYRSARVIVFAVPSDCDTDKANGSLIDCSRTINKEHETFFIVQIGAGDIESRIVVPDMLRNRNFQIARIASGADVLGLIDPMTIKSDAESPKPKQCDHCFVCKYCNTALVTRNRAPEKQSSCIVC